MAQNEQIDLIDGHKYIGTATDGKEYEFTFRIKGGGSGVLFGIYPAFTANGRKNEIIDLREAG